MNIFKRFGRAAASSLIILLVVTSVPSQQSTRRQQPTTRRRARATRTTHAARSSARSVRAATNAATPQQSPRQQRTVAPASNVAPQSRRAVGTASAQSSNAESEVAFDTLLPADAYTLYGEIRMVGQQTHQGGLLEMLEPIWSMNDAPKELRTLVSFLNTHAETLAASRLLFAGMPVVPTLPQGLVAVELPSEESARKFAPELQNFLASVAPRPAPAETNQQQQSRTTTTTGTRRVRLEAEANKRQPALPFHIQRAGALVVVSDSKFKLKDLHADADRLLANNLHFKTARSRFSAEPLFVFFNFGLMQRSMEERARERMTTQEKKEEAAPLDSGQQSIDMETATLSAVPTVSLPTEELSIEMEVGETDTETAPNLTAEATSPNSNDEEGPTAEESTEMDRTNPSQEGGEDALAGQEFGSLLAQMFFGSMSGERWPEAIGFAASTEGDTLAVRALLLNAPGAKETLIPFVPFLASGPALAPEGSSLLPADTDIYVSASLDFMQMYDRLTKTLEKFEKDAADSAPPPPDANISGVLNTTPAPDSQQQQGDNAGAPSAQLAAVEKLFGFKIREDLIGSLGNEVSVSVPPAWFLGNSRGGGAPSSPSAPNIVVLVALKDKETIKRILPRVLLALGMRKPNESAQPSKRKDVEMMSFGQFSLAFVGNFLAVSPSATSIEHLADASANGQTLASIEDFRTSTRWQPRQSLGQVYVSRSLFKSLLADARAAAEQGADPESRNLLALLNLEPGSATHAVTNEGDGALHEVRLPRNLLTGFAALNSIESKQAPMRSNEGNAMSALNHLNAVEQQYKETKGKGGYATLEQLVAEKLMPDFFLNNEGYRIELSINGDKFEATATPVIYPDKGRRSFFIDESGVIRGGDKGGQRASATDEPIKY